MTKSSAPICSDDRVAEIAGAIRESGVFGFDLEFLSADRYIPELCLIQVAWADAEPCAIDPLEADVGPILELVASEDVLTVAHSAKQDLQLLMERHQIEARRFVDTQIGAAFCGLGDQMGLSRLVDAVCGVHLDKGSQFTDWSKRPLSTKQLVYALDDVRYLLVVWADLVKRLEELDRLAWVEQESALLASDCSKTRPPEEMYRSVSGVGGVRGKALASLQELAAWRERKAREENKPPSWLIPDQAMVEACKRGARSPGDLKKLRGVGAGIVREHGQEILTAIERGRQQKPPAAETKTPLEQEAQWAASILSSLVQSECRRLKLAPRFVGARSEVESLVRWYYEGADDSKRGHIKLLDGWRREVLGNDVLAWLQGKLAIAAEKSGVLLVPRG